MIDRADARPDDAREVEAARVERDRAGKIVAPDQLDDERLPRRDLERVDHAVDRRENEEPARP